MAKVSVGDKPHLTTETTMEVFRRHFADRYTVYKKGWGYFLLQGRGGFAIEKNRWIGVVVSVMQAQPHHVLEEGTIFYIELFTPSMLLRFFLDGLFMRIFIRSSRKAMENEVKSFIENAPEFK